MDVLDEEFGASRVESAIEGVFNFRLDVPSWGFGRGGTRFGTYETADDPKGWQQRLDAAGSFHRITGQGAHVALHFPWDGDIDSCSKLAETLRLRGLRAGPVNPNWFSTRGSFDDRLRFGSFTNPIEKLRKASLDHFDECVAIAKRLESDVISVWLPDGTNSPGQMSFFDQSARLKQSLQTAYAHLEPGMKLFLEYKYFEPAFYSTAVPDWGTAMAMCQELGPNAKALVDLGHHPLGVNVEQIVANLLSRKARATPFFVFGQNLSLSLLVMPRIQ